MKKSGKKSKVDILEFGTFKKETVCKLITGYTSTERYAIIKKRGDGCLTIQLKLETLPSPHSNNFNDITDELWAHYVAIAQNRFLCARIG